MFIYRLVVSKGFDFTKGGLTWQREGLSGLRRLDCLRTCGCGDDCFRARGISCGLKNAEVNSHKYTPAVSSAHISVIN